MLGPQGVLRKPSAPPTSEVSGEKGGWQGDLWSRSKPPPSTDWATSLTPLPLTAGSGAGSHL